MFKEVQWLAMLASDVQSDSDSALLGIGYLSVSQHI